MLEASENKQPFNSLYLLNAYRLIWAVGETFTQRWDAHLIVLESKWVYFEFDSNLNLLKTVNWTKNHL
jgi:hypothetical protein